MVADSGRCPSGRATHEPGLASRPGHSVSVPNAGREAEAAYRLGRLYHEIQDGEYACSEIVCTFPHDGNCWCFNRALALHQASAVAGNGHLGGRARELNDVIRWLARPDGPRDYSDILNGLQRGEHCAAVPSEAQADAQKGDPNAQQ